jgi:glycine/D-amino acid oxidase-like deaminating enzyme
LVKVSRLAGTVQPWAVTECEQIRILQQRRADCTVLNCSPRQIDHDSEVSHTVLNQSLWMREALGGDASGGKVPVGDHHYDICVVGGGLVGLWSALTIKEREPGASVCVLEAGLCGSGASGANGGFAMTWWPKYATLVKLVGPERALVLCEESQLAVSELGRLCGERGIECEYAQRGWLWVATNRAQLSCWDEAVAALAAAKAEPFAQLSATEIAELGGSTRHLGGVFEAGVATVQPAKLVRGLMDRARLVGVDVYEYTPVRGHRALEAGVEVTFSGGRVVAGSVVMATNAWLAHYDEIRAHLLVLGSDIVATEQLERLPVEAGLAISDSRRLVHYYRGTQDGRMVFGKGGGRLAMGGRWNRATWSHSDREREVRAQLVATYPELAGVGEVCSWSGAVDYSVDSLPFFGRLNEDQRVVYGAGFSGNGVGPSFLAGKVLAAMALRQFDYWGKHPLIRVPTQSLPGEPWRAVGGRVVRAALEHKEHVEDSGHRAGRMVTAVASLDPTSFVG